MATMKKIVIVMADCTSGIRRYVEKIYREMKEHKVFVRMAGKFRPMKIFASLNNFWRDQIHVMKTEVDSIAIRQEQY
jgi:Ni,Fe-hydrogenase III small subunit